MKIKLYFPRWVFPNNLGDSLIFTFVPRLLKYIYPNSEIEVITYGFLIDIFKIDPDVDFVRGPNEQEIKLNYYSFHNYCYSNNQTNDIKVVVPEWHPNTFNFWKQNFKILEQHPTANIITVNYLLQLKLENLLFSSNFDFIGRVNTLQQKNCTDNINIGIVPSTKLSGKTTPHPSCDGLGFRFNGLNGLESWKKLCNFLKKNNQKIKIFEFSPEFLNIGDYHCGYRNNIFKLFQDVDFMDYGVMTDGGVHHAFNLRNKKVFLFQASKVYKTEFLKIRNSIVPEHLLLDCRKKCPHPLSVIDGEDASLTCKNECEKLDPIKLGNFILKNISK